MKNNFLQITLGISALLLSGALFIKTLTPASATPPTPVAFEQQGTSSIGKYQIDLEVANDPDAVYFYAVIWNTENGENSIYAKNSKTGGEWVPWTYNIPSPKK
jgi:hypothetical protein